MRDFKAYAAVWSNRPLLTMPVPHEGSAAALSGDVLLCSSVLPWYACRSVWPDKGPDIPTITVMTLDRIRPHLESHAQVVWGGDFNNTLIGPHGPGTKRGRKAIQRLTDDLALQVVTADLQHTLPGRFSIDHIAVPTHWSVDDCFAVVAEHEGMRLSDHDAYVVDVTMPLAASAHTQ